jgi:hypothetical protein
MDDEQLIVLLIDIGRVNAQAGEDGILPGQQKVWVNSLGSGSFPKL